MGDLIHALPSLTDAATVFPDIEFDWVVDEAFADIPLWHPNVRRVIKTANRQWRKQLLLAWNEGYLYNFYRDLNSNNYDVIIDLQSNLKSALVSSLRKGHVHGFDKNNCREKFSYWAYKYKYQVKLGQHSIERLRELMAKILNYIKPSTFAHYGVSLKNYPLPELGFELPKYYLLFVHNASWATKLLPLSSWRYLINKVVGRGYSVLLPCGNDEEYQRAQEIARASDKAYALPKLSLNHIAALIQNSQGALCSDTGLAHVAAVSNVPMVTIYGATDVQLIGTHGNNQQYILSNLACSPCYKRICPLRSSKNDEPVCMANINVESIWDKLNPYLTKITYPLILN